MRNNARPNGVFIPVDKMAIVLEALYIYRQIVALGRRAEDKSRNTDLYAQVCRVVGYISRHDFEMPKKEEPSKRSYARQA